MTILYTKQFLKHYRKRIKPYPKLQKRFKERVKLFAVDRTTPILYDHKLKGKKRSFRSFSVSGDVRVVYHKQDEETVLFLDVLDVGTHMQVYGK